MKKDTKYILLALFVIALVVVTVIFAIGYKSTVPLTGGGGAQPLASCTYHDQHNLFLTATDMGQTAVAVDLSAKIYTINSDNSLHYVGTVANDTAFNIAPNVKYAAYVTSSGYFPVYFEDVTDCSSATHKTFSMAYADDSLTLTVINSNGITENGVGTANDPVGTGGTVHPQIQIVGGVSYAYATDPVYKHGYIGIQWNTSEWDRTNTQATFDGSPCEYASVSDGRSGTDNAALKCTGNVFNGARKYLDLQFKALDGVDPVNASAMTIVWCPYGTAQNTINDAVMKDKTENNVGTPLVACQTLATYYYS